MKFSKHERDFLFFLNNIPAEGIILDIGANIGITSVPLAKHHRHTVVYSFEPVPQNVKALKRVVKFFQIRNIKIFEYALGAEPASLNMVIPVINNVKMQGLSHITEAGDPEQGIILEVPVKKLDEIDELSVADRIAAIKLM